MTTKATFCRSETDAIVRLVNKRRSELLDLADEGQVKPSVIAIELATLNAAMAKITDATT